jgi:hypothetical protein
MGTIVNTNRQVFANDFAASGTHLRCVSGINSCDCPTSFLRFEGRVLHESPPGDIGDAFVHPAMVAVLHSLNLQVLEDDELEPVDQVATDLMGEVPPAVGDALVDVLHHALALEVLWRALLARAQAALRLGQRAFVLAEEVWIGNMLACAQGGKVRQTDINAGHLVGGGQRLRFDLAGEAGIPVAEAVATDGEGLDLALDGPVKSDLDVADLGESEPTVVEEAKVALLLGICEAVEAVPALEAGIARLLVTGLDPAEEGTECRIDALFCSSCQVSRRTPSVLLYTQRDVSRIWCNRVRCPLVGYRRYLKVFRMR